MTKTICLKCDHANWLRTNSGRLHPSGQGKCTWQRTIQTPAAGLSRGVFGFADRGDPLTLEGSNLWRNDDIHTKCPTFQPKEKEPK